jgi:hypothetical protein
MNRVRHRGAYGIKKLDFWNEVPLKIDFYKSTSMPKEVRQEIYEFTRDVASVIGKPPEKKKFPTGSKYQIANEMLTNAYKSLTEKDRTIHFDFSRRENDEYFFNRFATFIREIINTKTINEKYLLVFKYNDITRRRLLTDDTALSILRNLDQQKLAVGYITDEFVEGSGNEPIPIPFRELQTMDIIDLNNSNINNHYNLLEGGFFAWTNKSNIDLERFMIFKKINRHAKDVIQKDNCLIYAFKMSGLIEQSKIDHMRDTIKSTTFPLKKIEKISREYDINITILNATDMRKHYFWVNNGPIVELLLYKNHYMLNENLTITSFWRKVNIRRAYPIHKILEEMFEKNFFTPISIADIINVRDVELELTDLSYDPKLCCHLKKIAKSMT